MYNLYTNVCENFAIPVYNCIGNHELFGLFEESGVNPDHPEYAKNNFKNRIGRGQIYRSFNHKGWHIIILDDIGITETRGYTGYIGQEQLEWLKADLAKLEKGTPIIVALHIPIFSFFKQMENDATIANRHNHVFLLFP